MRDPCGPVALAGLPISRLRTAVGASPNQRREEREKADESPGRPRVLIADDAAGMRTYLRTILTGAGFDCLEAGDGGEAFDAIMAERFDLLITDLDMPGVDGFQLISAISLLPKSKDRPGVIVCSALLDEGLAERRPELRLASALLAKPAQPRDVPWRRR